MLLYIFISLHFNISILHIIDLITFIYGEIQKKNHTKPPPLSIPHLRFLSNSSTEILILHLDSSWLTIYLKLLTRSTRFKYTWQKYDKMTLPAELTIQLMASSKSDLLKTPKCVYTEIKQKKKQQKKSFLKIILRNTCIL